MRRRQACGKTVGMTTHRILTPDVARGIMLLAIAVANSVTVWATNIDNPMVGTHIGIVMHDSLWDKIAIMFGAMFIHVRGLPMFATLLGYGMGMILVREYHRKNPYKRILARRYAALAAMGLIHLVFLFFGDIMFIYGILALHVTMIANRSDRLLLTVAGVLWVAGGGVTAALTLLGWTGTSAYGLGYVEDQLVMAETFLMTFPVQYVSSATTIMPAILVGFVAGRRGMLETPEPYLRIMRWWAIIAVAVCFIVGIPLGLASMGVIGGELVWSAINRVAGLVTGPGLVVLLFYLSRWLQQHHKQHVLPVRMLVALGRMSMTGYVLQSVLFTALVLPWGLGLGSGSGAAVAMLMGVAVWFLTLIIVYAWSLTGRRGPLETIHRRLGYSRPTTALRRYNGRS